MNKRSILMGDPSHFHIRGGANPHTRDAWGRKKTVDAVKALAQWHALAQALEDHGVEVYVVPAVPTSPGLVFPANAGYLPHADDATPWAEKTFVLSHALPTRAAEREIGRRFLENLGFATKPIPFRFEGEADLFPAGDAHLFTSGEIVRQRFVPRWGWPPYRRKYGFRSDPEALEVLKLFVEGPVLPLTLVKETHYHGDTCLCAFGPSREHLMAYMPALAPESQAAVKEQFKDRLILLSDKDGENFAANSFQLANDKTLFMPAGVSDRLLAQIKERGVDPLTFDVSEFMLKGGGSVKCMIGDLGAPDPSTDSPREVKEFREARRYPANVPPAA